MTEGGSRVLEIDLETRFGRLTGSLAVPSGGMRLPELAWNVMGLDDRLIGLAAASEARHGRQISCRKGCGACCRQAVPLSPPEAWMLRDLLVSMPLQRRAAVLERFARVKERLEREGFGQRSLTSAASMDQVQQLGLDYLRLGLPCPFLEDESCSIHPHRPSACREYLVTSPASFCSDPGAHPIQPVPLAASLTEALSRLAAAVMGGEPRVMPLVTALDWAEEHKEEGEARYDPVVLIALLVRILTGGKTPAAGTAG